MPAGVCLAAEPAHDVLEQSPSVLGFFEPQHRRICSRAAEMPQLSETQFLAACRYRVRHCRPGRIDQSVAALQYLKKCAVLLPTIQNRPTSQAFIEADGDLEPTAAEGHVAAVS